jgi:hypothetical protein
MKPTTDDILLLPIARKSLSALYWGLDFTSAAQGAPLLIHAAIIHAFVFQRVIQLQSEEAQKCQAP